MMSRRPLRAVKASYRATDKRKILAACTKMEELLRNDTLSDMEFHEHLMELKVLVLHAEMAADIRYYKKD